MLRVGEVEVVDDSLNDKSRDRKVEDIKKYLEGKAVIHEGKCYLHSYFLREYKKCTYLSWLYSLVWKCNTYEIELNYISKINGVSLCKMEKSVSQLIEKYYNVEGTLDLMIEEVVRIYNQVEKYELELENLHYV